MKDTNLSSKIRYALSMFFVVMLFQFKLGAKELVAKEARVKSNETAIVF
jgi:hypothetical protein